MTPYWIIFAIPALFSLSTYKATRELRVLTFTIVATLFILMIGLRYEVGGDWDSYLNYIKMMNGISLLEAMAINDPAYMALNWLSAQLEFGIYGVNLVCGVLFMFGLVKFCQDQPLPWLALTVATPYLLIVVAMGYSRQGVALGLALWALYELQNKKIVRFLIFIVFAALFHKSATILLPLMQIHTSKNSKTRNLLFLLLAIFVTTVLVIDTISSQWQNYVEAQMQSEGGAIRMWMNVLPATILFACRRKWERMWPQSIEIWKWLAIASIACVPLQALASTAVDRLALYITPLQLVVYSRFPLMLSGHWRAASLMAILLLYGVVLFVWLNFSTNAIGSWVPYKWVLF